MASRGSPAEGGIAWENGRVAEHILEEAEQTAGAEWYVAEADAEVGPLTLEDLEARWRIGALQEETPVWRPGMEDWAPLIEVGDLTYLVISLPQSEEPRVVPAEPAWKPVTVDSLPDLVAWELDHSEQRTLPSPGNGSPSFLTDYDSPGLRQKLPPNDPFALVSTPSIAGPTPGTPWPAATRPRRKSRRRLTWTLLGTLGIAMLVLAGIATAVLTRGTAAVLAAAGLQPELAPPEEATARPDSDQMRLEPVRWRSTAPRPKKRLSRPASRRPRHSGPTAASRAGRAPLARDEVVDGIKRNAKNLSQCLNRARATGELTPGMHSFVLAWVIREDGTVANPRLVGPTAVLGTSLRACFESRMRKWKFAKSTKGSTVKSFRLPVRIR